MKRKAINHFSSKQILERAHKYIDHRYEEELTDPNKDDTEPGKPLRKATEADRDRKREKARLKRQKKRELKKSQSTCSNDAKTEAISYLKAWKKDRDRWTFKKTKQMWLLRNVYNLDNISDKHFKTLLKYLVGLQGGARERLLQEAERKINCAEESDCKPVENEDGSRNIETESKEKIEKILERARSILQRVV